MLKLNELIYVKGYYRYVKGLKEIKKIKHSGNGLTTEAKRSVVKLLLIMFLGTYLLGLIQKSGPFVARTVVAESTPAPIKLVSPESTYSPSPTLIPEQTGKWDNFKLAAKKIAKIYNYPVNVIISQCALESGRGTSPFAIERNNFCGIGAVDWDPSLAWKFENAEDCVISYIQLVRKNFPEAYASKSNPDKVILFLVNNPRQVKYATDPAYIQKVKAMPEWKENI